MSNYKMTNRQKCIDRVCRYRGISPGSVTDAARNLGELRFMEPEEIDEQITSLEDEVIRHLQAAQAVAMTVGI